MVGRQSPAGRQETMPYILGGDRVQLPGKSHVDIQVGLGRGKKKRQSNHGFTKNSDG